MSLELVRWVDAHFHIDKPTKKVRKDTIVRTVGWTREQDGMLRIVGERTPEGPRAITYVPLVLIVDRIPLRREP
jgi:hypothetical protein